MSYNLFRKYHPAYRQSSTGFSVIEIIVAVAIVGILAMIATSSYEAYFERARNSEAINDINLFSVQIIDYRDTYDRYPLTLADINITKTDPWGNPYQYVAVEHVKGKGKLRKDRSLVPINSDFDLYSMGPDGRSVGPLTAKASQDDIVRANNGRYVGLAEDY